MRPLKAVQIILLNSIIRILFSSLLSLSWVIYNYREWWWRSWYWSLFIHICSWIIPLVFDMVQLFSLYTVFIINIIVFIADTSVWEFILNQIFLNHWRSILQMSNRPQIFPFYELDLKVKIRVAVHLERKIQVMQWILCIFT